jgi:hypothetical protein
MLNWAQYIGTSELVYYMVSPGLEDSLKTMLTFFAELIKLKANYLKF